MKGLALANMDLFKNKSCQTILISSFDRITGLVDKDNVMSIIFLGFKKVLNAIPHAYLFIFTNKL